MIGDPRPGIKHWIRRYLGTDNLEETMATATEQLQNLTTKVDDLTSDIRSALAVINEDTLSDTAQAALDSLTAKIEAFDTEVGDADGSDTVVPPVEPVDPETPNQI